MMRQILPMIVLGIVLGFHLPATAVEVARSVIGSGGGILTGGSFVVSGSTAGQAAIGFMSGPSHVQQAGFCNLSRILTPVREPDQTGTNEYWFGPNHPNPFNPVTTLQFSVTKRSRVTMKLYDVNGREVMKVLDRDLDPGGHQVVLDAEGLSSGVYFCRMVADRFSKTRKLVLLK